MPHGAAGFFGKLPSAGDFVQRRLPASFVDVWDRHFERRCGAEPRALGDAGRGLRASPVWRFLLAPGHLRRRGLGWRDGAGVRSGGALFSDGDCRSRGGCRRPRAAMRNGMPGSLPPSGCTVRRRPTRRRRGVLRGAQLPRCRIRWPHQPSASGAVLAVSTGALPGIGACPCPWPRTASLLALWAQLQVCRVACGGRRRRRGCRRACWSRVACLKAAAYAGFSMPPMPTAWRRGCH